jgi:hypothetical protein
MRQLPYLITIFALLAAGPVAAVQWEAKTAPNGGSGTAATDITTFQGRGMTLEQAVAQVRRQYPGGKIVSADTRVSGGRETHVIKVLTADGTVKTVRIPGRST